MQPPLHSVHEAAFAALMTADPGEKLAATRALVANWGAGRYHSGVVGDGFAVRHVPAPGRPERPRLVPPRELAPRPLGTPEGRVALVHAVAHIEFNAINLALDVVYRWPELPRAFHDDWLGVAADEARHFAMLAGRLEELGAAYGDLPAHDGLWEMAVRTAHDPIARMALVPRVLEARGLDVTPGMIKRLRRAGDDRTAAMLEVILAEEVAHVAAGTRWFRWLCRREGLDPDARFAELIGGVAIGAIRGPFNRPARLEAGFTEDEIGRLEAIGGVPTAAIG